MARFFIAASNIFGGVAYLDHKDSEHIKGLRFKDGEVITFCDGNGTDYTCKVEENSQDGEITARIIETAPSSGEASVHCVVFAAYPEGDRADTIIKKCVELGVNEICFFPSKLCASIPDEKALIRKTNRWQNIALEAARESGRGRIPKVRALPSFEYAVEEACGYQLPLFLNEHEKDLGIKAAIEERPDAKTIAVMTGPEEGFTPAEAEFAGKTGMRSVTIGQRILRNDTAVVGAVTAVMLMTGNMQ